MPEKHLSTDWFRTAFGEHYRCVYPHRTDAAAAHEVSDLLGLLDVCAGGALVLDVGCGTGRHAAALAEAGVGIIGIDLSNALVRAAAARSALRGRVTLGDMRFLPFAQAFDLVVNLFTSFGYFDDDQNAATLREMARVLVPGGVLVIDHINAARLARSLVPRDRRACRGYVVEQCRRIEGNRVRKDVTVMWDDGSVQEFGEDVRLYAPRELASLVIDAGFGAVRFYGSYDGAPYAENSERMILVARKGP